MRVDEAIDRVLAGLREAAAPEGMERRILEAVRERATVREGAAAAARQPWVWGVALAGPATLCAAIYLTGIGTGHKHAVAKGHTNAAQARAVAVQGSLRGTIRRTGGTQARAKRIEDEDSLEMREMRAPSLPAPEMPLTEQERLLLRIAHQGDPELLAMLEPEVQAKLEADDVAEYQRFFSEPVREPTTAEPASLAPTTAEPTAAEPTAAEPTLAEPTTAEPATGEIK